MCKIKHYIYFITHNGLNVEILHMYVYDNSVSKPRQCFWRKSKTFIKTCSM